MYDLIVLALLVPLATGAVALLQRKELLSKFINLLGGSITSGLVLTIVYNIGNYGVFSEGLFYVDQLSALLLMVVAVLSFTALLASLSYMDNEVKQGHITAAMLPRYYSLFYLFVFTMIGLLVVRNIGLMWVAVEATTLASALLVAFYFNRTAIEAAWKYVMVCSVGICLALLGIIILYYAQINAQGVGAQALDWTILKDIGPTLDKGLVKLAFVFIIIGYGTKAGLAPMHTWLPDAHSQAPSPISGLLSGALLSCAIYAILRNLIIAQDCVGREFTHYLLLIFGVLSIVIAIPFILIQCDIKRILAYSSVEHMGLITVGLGIGTPIAVYGALLHILNHAVTKSVLFYMSGAIIQKYRTKQMLRIRGLVSVMPVIGTLFLAAVLAIAGLPPFNIFVSKYIIAMAVFEAGHGTLGLIILLLLGGIFAGFMYYAMHMGFGQTGPQRHRGTDTGVAGMSAILLSALIILILGLYVPPWLNELIIKAAEIVVGG